MVIKKMQGVKFELTNHDRKYLGLAPLEGHWEKVVLTDQIDIYFDGGVIKREIVCSDTHYRESQMDELTAENRTVLLPKTKRGKPKKLNFTSYSKRNGKGVYFRFDSYVTIASYTTQTTFLSTDYKGIKDFKALRKWLNQYIDETTPEDLAAINQFKIQERKHVKFTEGDFFRFKIDRRNYGYGRILFDVYNYRKSKEFKATKNHGLASLMGKILVVKVYHTISEKKLSIEKLGTLKAFPSQYIMDNHFFYGEYEIVGNLPLEDELDFPMSHSQSIHSSDRDTIYFQWGKIYLEGNPDLDKYMDGSSSIFRNEGTGMGLHVNKQIIEEGIKEDSNAPYWSSKHYYGIKDDLRNPKNSKERTAIFGYFGLDEGKSYTENLKSFEAE